MHRNRNYKLADENEVSSTFSFEEDLLLQLSMTYFLLGFRSRYKGRINAVQSSQSRARWTGQYTNCVQYDFKFTTIYTVTVVCLYHLLEYTCITH